MKINSIKISNILSFEHKDNIEDAEEIKLNEKLNILIGPNGSGKTNFLEILNGIYKGILIKQSFLDINNLNKPEMLKNTVQIKFHNYKLEKNRDFFEKEQVIKLIMDLNEIDIKNLNIIINNKEIIKSLIDTYSELGGHIQINISKNDINNFKKIQLTIKSNDGSQFGLEQITFNKDGDIRNFISQYIEYFNVFKNIIILNNEINENKIENLKNTFYSINSYREYDNITLNFNLNGKKEEIEAIINKNINETKIKKYDYGNEPQIFNLVRSKLGFNGKRILRQGGEEKMNTELNNNEILKSINIHLEKINLKYIFSIDSENRTTQIKFERNGKDINFQGLSSGEKSIIYLIFSIYGYDLINGLLIVDEPELHLHPLLQKVYLKIITEISQINNTQVIIVTHSPNMINENSIYHVIRFYKNQLNYTQTIFPGDSLLKMKNLSQIIHYTNSEKIFFANKILLVEGDTDEYFFKFFWEKYKQDNNILIDLEIIYIGGKNSYKNWNNFLMKFNIETYYIGDWDNILNLNDIIDINTTINKAIYENIKRNKTIINKKYIKPCSTCHKELLNYDEKRQKKEEIFNNNKISSETLINEIHNKNIYILKEGELEDYLGIQKKSKSLENICNFCLNDFEEWYIKNESKQNELKIIFSKICS